MPEIGLLDEPISPVSRDETVTNRKPKATIKQAARIPRVPKPNPRLGVAARATINPKLPRTTKLRGKSRWVRGKLARLSDFVVSDFAAARSRTAPRNELKMRGKA